MKLIWQMAIYIIVATSSLAEPMTVSSLRQAVYERDFGAVDIGLANAQSAYLAGDLTADNIRDLFIALSRSDPKMVSFVADWLKNDPDNPKAQIARAWSLYDAAGYVAQGRNELAYEVSEDMYTALYALAHKAYASDPDLIPASDAMIRGFPDYSSVTPHDLIAFDKIQEEHPNWGSVLRAVMERPGVSANLTRKFCANIATGFPEGEGPKMEHRCLMTAGAMFGRTALRPYVEQHLWDDTDAALTVERLRYFITRYDFADATEDEINWAKTALLSYPANQFELTTLASLAQTFENKIGAQHGIRDRFFDTFSKARLALAEEYLKHDPYNLDLIDLVEGVAFSPLFEAIETADGKTIYRSGPLGDTPEERKSLLAQQKSQNEDFKKRRLRASPYNSGLWLDYAQFAMRRDMPMSLYDGEAALQNAVVYSDDPAKALSQVIGEKQTQFTMFNRYQDLTDAQRAELPDWQNVNAKTNLAYDLLCPYLRARLLYEKVCEYYPASANQCRSIPTDADAQMAKLHKLAISAPECAGHLTASIEELWYTEKEFSEAVR